MRVRVGDLRRVINEELNGVPEWQLRQDTSHFVDQLRARIKRFILLNKSENAIDRQQSIAAMNATCDELEEAVYDAVETGIFNFTRRV